MKKITFYILLTLTVLEGLVILILVDSQYQNEQILSGNSSTTAAAIVMNKDLNQKIAEVMQINEQYVVANQQLAKENKQIIQANKKLSEIVIKYCGADCLIVDKTQ